MKALVLYGWQNLEEDQLENITAGLRAGVEARGLEPLLPKFTGDMSFGDVGIALGEELAKMEPGDIVLYHGIGTPRMLEVVGRVMTFLDDLQEVKGDPARPMYVMPYSLFVRATPQQWDELNQQEIMYAGMLSFLKGHPVEEFTEENVAQYLKEGE